MSEFQARDPFQALVYKLYDYKVYSEEVAAFHASSATTKIVSSPARTSKSFTGWKDALPDALRPGLLLLQGQPAKTIRIWIVAPNYDLAKEFDYAYTDLVERKDVIGFDYEVKVKQNSPKTGAMHIHLHFGKNPDGTDVDLHVTVKTAANEQSLQSEEVDIAILSEAARLPSIVWTKYLNTRTGRSIWPTTPDLTAAWIYEEIQNGLSNPQLSIESFAFTGRANPEYKWRRFWTEHAKAEIRVEGEVQTKPSDAKAPPSAANGHDCFSEHSGCNAGEDNGFAEQFLGKWVFHRGRVVPIREWDEPSGVSHVIHKDPDWLREARWGVATDYGFVDNAVAGFFAQAHGRHVLRRCVYVQGRTSEEFLKEIAVEWQWLRDRFGLYRKTADFYVGDPKKPEVAKQFRNLGLPIWDMNKKAQADREAGHRQLMSYLATVPGVGVPGLQIHSDCQSIINEFRTLRWNEKARSEGQATAVIGTDDGYDMLRYYVQSQGPSKLDSLEIKVDHFQQARMEVIRARSARSARRATVPMSSGMSAPRR